MACLAVGCVGCGAECLGQAVGWKGVGLGRAVVGKVGWSAILVSIQSRTDAGVGDGASSSSGNGLLVDSSHSRRVICCWIIRQRRAQKALRLG